MTKYKQNLHLVQKCSLMAQVQYRTSRSKHKVGKLRICGSVLALQGTIHFTSSMSVQYRPHLASYANAIMFVKTCLLDRNHSDLQPPPPQLPLANY
jgi:hypothetical protein